MWPNSLVESGQVSDGEQGVTFGEQPKTSHDISLAVGRQRAERVFLEHLPDMLELSPGLLITLRINPFSSFIEW